MTTEAERRGHLRYRDPDGGILRLAIDEGGEERMLTALTVNESHTGLACVYVGAPLAEESSLVWRAPPGIGTPCRVKRCERLAPDVYLLALQIQD